MNIGIAGSINTPCPLKIQELFFLCFPKNNSEVHTSTGSLGLGTPDSTTPFRSCFRSGKRQMPSTKRTVQVPRRRGEKRMELRLMDKEEDERREAAIASSQYLQPNFKVKGVTQDQLSKFQVPSFAPNSSICLHMHVCICVVRFCLFASFLFQI